jgi:hypothetical protein
VVQVVVVLAVLHQIGMALLEQPTLVAVAAVRTMSLQQ